MSGHWVKRGAEKVDTHRCELPNLVTTETYKGDIYQCDDCGQRWVVYSRHYPDGASFQDWRKKFWFGKKRVMGPDDPGRWSMG